VYTPLVTVHIFSIFFKGIQTADVGLVRQKAA